jgi:hypothetical protein
MVPSFSKELIMVLTSLIRLFFAFLRAIGSSSLDELADIDAFPSVVGIVG